MLTLPPLGVRYGVDENCESEEKGRDGCCWWGRISQQLSSSSAFPPKCGKFNEKFVGFSSAKLVRKARDYVTS